MELYRDIDIQAITDNLDKIIDDANLIVMNTMEPTFSEYTEVIKVINNFIKEKKRVIYGGTAWNELLKMKNSKEIIYKKTDVTDIEFYSPTPVADLIELCDILNNADFKYVSGRDAMHAETYTIFVNFEPRCDISYMEQKIYYNMPTITFNNILYTHPLWILVDILRQYNDPLTSYWRLKDKTFFRGNLLLKAFPLTLTNGKIKIKDTNLEIKKDIFNKIYMIDSLIFLGSIAMTYYLKRTSEIVVNQLECISSNYEIDIKNINNILKDIMGDEYKLLTIKFYRPFFQFFDERVEFIYNDDKLISIFNNTQKCNPYHNLYINIKESKINTLQLGGYIKKKIKREIKKNDNIKLATFILYFNHLLITRHYYYINRSKKYKDIEIIMNLLLKERLFYLKKKNITVIDKSPYQEFIIKCNGKPKDSKRDFKLKIEDRKKKNQRYFFTYTPDKSKTIKIPHIKFDNTSGNVDKNKKI